MIIDTHLESTLEVYTSHTDYTPMNLTQEQQETLNNLTQLITDKYEEQLWTECYYEGDNQQIKDLLGSLMKQGVEVNFSVTLTPYDNNL